MQLSEQLVQTTTNGNQPRRRPRGRRISIWQPYSWPRSWRRIALLTLPLAICIWLVVAICLGLRLAYLDARKPLARFWNAPSRRRGYGYFSY